MAKENYCAVTVTHEPNDQIYVEIVHNDGEEHGHFSAVLSTKGKEPKIVGDGDDKLTPAQRKEIIDVATKAAFKNKKMKEELLRMRELAGVSKLNEAKREYDDSADFTDAMVTVGAAIAKSRKEVGSAAWKNWVKVTETNFDAPTVKALSDALFKALVAADEAYDKFEAAMNAAGE